MKGRLKSIRYALDGVVAFFRSEPNAVIHLVATVLVIILSVVVKLQQAELLTIVIVTGLVWMAELFNTAIEKIMDFISPDKHPAIRFIKDISAAGVLISALVALVAGGIIFLPKLFLQ